SLSRLKANRLLVSCYCVLPAPKIAVRPPQAKVRIGIIRLKTNHLLESFQRFLVALKVDIANTNTEPCLRIAGVFLYSLCAIRECFCVVFHPEEIATFEIQALCRG